MKASKPDSNHWAEQRERGSPWLMRLTVWATTRLGRRAMKPIVWLVVLYFYLTDRRTRRSIADYQRRLSRAYPALRMPRHAPVYRQYLAFSDALLDKFDVWQGKINISDVDLVDIDGLNAQMKAGPGQLLIGSHLGNLELCRALAEREQKLTLNVLVHSKHAQAFNALLGKTGAVHLRLVQISELNAGRMIELSQSLARGEWIALAGDRIPQSSERTVEVNFLGARAPFPQGPWLLAGLLGCPVNILDCTRHDGRHRIALTRLTEQIQWTRANREQEVKRWAQAYADHLAQRCAQAPLQWFNFYPFWSDDA